MTDQNITVPRLTWVFHHDQLSRAIQAWREKLNDDELSSEEVDQAINNILDFLASTEAKTHKMVME